MTPPRLIPCLLLSGHRLVKTCRFKDPRYIGDPTNAVRIFNEKEVDELVILDIDATANGQAPQMAYIQEIVSEAFMPVAYGGGIRSAEQARDILRLGVEKVILSASALETPGLVRRVSSMCGSQSTLVCLDVRNTKHGWEVCTHGGRRPTGMDPVTWAVRMEAEGAGELIVNDTDRDGTMAGYDLPLIQAVAAAVSLPVVALGGAGSIGDMVSVIEDGHASAAAAGSLFVFFGRAKAVMIQYPSRETIQSAFFAYQE